MGNDWQVLKRELEDYAEKRGVPIIRGPERELLLKAAALAEPRRMLEIGTAIGYSALLLAERFPKAQIHTVELDEERYHMAFQVMERAGLTGRVHCMLGDAGQVIPTLRGPMISFSWTGPKDST